MNFINIHNKLINLDRVFVINIDDEKKEIIFYNDLGKDIKLTNESEKVFEYCKKIIQHNTGVYKSKDILEEEFDEMYDKKK